MQSHVICSIPIILYSHASKAEARRQLSDCHIVIAVRRGCGMCRVFTLTDCWQVVGHFQHARTVCAISYVPAQLRISRVPCDNAR
jgi:hypothetical protein